MYRIEFDVVIVLTDLFVWSASLFILYTLHCASLCDKKTIQKKMGIQDEMTTTTTKSDSIVVDDEKKAKKKKRKRTNGSKGNDVADEGDTNKHDNDTAAVVETNKDSHKSDADDDDNDDDNDDPTTKSKRKRKRKRKTKTDSAETDATATSSSKSIEASSHDSKLASLDRTIYVEGLPFDATESDVIHWFEARDCDAIEELRLATWHDTGRLRGYGHVVFVSSRAQGLACHGQTMGKRYLTIVPAKAPKVVPTMIVSEMTATTTTVPNPTCRVVFVKNLPYHATEDDILESFQVCGKIVDGGIRIARHSNNTAQSKGFAYVEYKNPEGAQGAVVKASKPFGLAVLGRPVFVDYDDKGGRMKGSYKLQDGRLWTKQYGAKK